MYIGLTNAMRAEAVEHQHRAAEFAKLARMCRVAIKDFGVDTLVTYATNVQWAATSAHHARTVLFQLIGDTATEDELPLCDYTATTWTHEEAVAECYSRIAQRYAELHAGVDNIHALDFAQHSSYLSDVRTAVYMDAMDRWRRWTVHRTY